MPIQKYTVTYTEVRSYEVDVEVDTDDMDIDTETNVEDAMQLRAVELADQALVSECEPIVRVGIVSLDTESIVAVTK